VALANLLYGPGTKNLIENDTLIKMPDNWSPANLLTVVDPYRCDKQ
jgi:hypothetical protein